MKTLSVKQVADVLGVSPRAVLKRLNNGQLKGTRRTNKYGVEEWWVYPTKEIRASLEAAGRIDILGESLSDAEIVDAEEASVSNDNPVYEQDEDTSQINPGAWTGNTRETTSGVAEELWNNIISRFLGELKERDQLIGEMRSELADKERQLKLLPDLQKRAEEEHRQAEEERKASELKELEAEALRKQIAAMQDEQQQAEEEIARLKEEKEAEAKAVKEQLQALAATVEELKQPKPPWWKKWFAPVPPQGS
jgi:hypothetical protein